MIKIQWRRYHGQRMETRPLRTWMKILWVPLCRCSTYTYRHHPGHQSLQWSHNECDGASNHRLLDGLLNRLLKFKSKKTSKLRVTGFVKMNSPHKGPVTREMFPFDDAIMTMSASWLPLHHASPITEELQATKLDMIISRCIPLSAIPYVIALIRWHFSIWFKRSCEMSSHFRG